MPNLEYDTRTPEEKKKLMRGMLNVEEESTVNQNALKKADSKEDDGRGQLHRHLA